MMAKQQKPLTPKPLITPRLTDISFAPVDGGKAFIHNGVDPLVEVDASTIAPPAVPAQPPKPEKRRPLKPRDKKFLEVKAKNPDMPDYKAAMAVTGAKDMNTASTQAARMLQNVTLREALEDALMNQGFTIDDGARVLVDALSANKSAQGATISDEDENGNRTAIGLVETDIPDHAIRINAAKTIFAFLQDKSDPGGGNTFNFIGQNNFVKKDAA
jgi:hypothetical protein